MRSFFEPLSRYALDKTPPKVWNSRSICWKCILPSYLRYKDTPLRATLRFGEFPDTGL